VRSVACMQLVLFYDGDCGFCDRTVRFVLRHDRAGTMCFAPLQGEAAREAFARHPSLGRIDSLILIERDTVSGGDHVSVRSEAVIRVATYLGGPWRAAALLRLVPRTVRDWGYDLIARNRHGLLRRASTCAMPDVEHRSRFVR
jgi:predicted DCC family thiol-disulfide oxidoreductase YuxK